MCPHHQEVGEVRNFFSDKSALSGKVQHFLHSLHLLSMRKSPKFLRFWQQKKITCVGSCRLDKFRKLNSLNCVDVFCYFLWKMAYCIWWNMEIACDSQRKANTKYKSYEFFWVLKSALKKFHIVPFCTFAYIFILKSFSYLHFQRKYYFDVLM